MRNKQTKWQIEQAIRTGMAVRELASRYPEIEPRLTGGLDGLGSAIDEARAAESSAKSARAERRAATAAQLDTVREALRVVAGVRRAIRLAFPRDRAVQRAFGVGGKLRRDKVGAAAAALQTALDAAGREPERLPPAGILSEDIDEGKQVLARLLAADAGQEALKVAATAATAHREATQARLESRVGQVLGVVAIVFRNHPEILRQFLTLVPSPRHRAEPGTAGAEPSPSSESIAA